MAESFGKRLRRLRGSRSQKEIAAGVGIPTTTYASLEQQASIPRGPVLQRLCGYFGVSHGYFFPPSEKAVSPAREWLKAQRERRFDVTPTVATSSVAEISQEEKEKVDRALGARKIAKA
jgi:transcriptional regulator with XRE-family HTH domain